MDQTKTQSGFRHFSGKLPEFDIEFINDFSHIQNVKKVKLNKTLNTEATTSIQL